MPVAQHLRAGTRRHQVRGPELVAASTALLILLGAAGGGLPPYPAAAVAVGLTTAVVTTRLVRLALRLHAGHGFGPCRGAGFLAMGVLASGGTLTAVTLAPPAARTQVAVTGLVVAIALFLLGMLLLPGTASTVSIRLRRGFDGLSLGISLAFSAWVIPPAGRMPPVALVAGLLAAGALSIITITALRAAAHRRAALFCGAGAGTGVVGLAVLTMMLAYQAPPAAVLLPAGALVLGPVLAGFGARRADPVHRPTDRELPETHVSAYPLLTVPAVVATLAAVYRLVTVGEFDRTSIVLGLAVIPTLVVREVLAVFDIRRYARRLVSQEAHFRSLVSGANDLTLVVGDDLLVRWQSPAAARLFGLSDAEVLGRPFADLMHPDDGPDVTAVLTDVLTGRQLSTGRPPLVTARLADGHGAWRETESTVSDQRSVPEVGALVVHVRDVGERRRLERTLHHLSFTDQLTGLANRRELMRAIVTQRGVPGHTGAVLVVDLHGMAGVNDVHGREVGDTVLIEVGRRLQDVAGCDDVVARLGGDEFALVTVDGPVLAYGLGTRLLTVLTEPYQLPGAVVTLGVSIGLADLSGGDGVDDVLRRADLARRRARQLGRNRVEWYDAYLAEQLDRRMDLERELPGAVKRGELDLVYQPVLGLHDQQPVGTEAFLRWRSPALGTVLPAELLPVADDLGLLDELGRWVIQTACRQLAIWSHGGRRLWMAVNVSPGELCADDFLSAVSAALTAYQLAPDRLVVEVAEPRVAAELPPVVSQLAELRALGVRTALDDFGTGQASLAQLRRMPVDFLKVDRGLVVDRSAWRGQSRPLIDVVVSLGRRLGVEIIAEGLESVEQVDQARTAGCRFGQGNALSRPAPAERVEAYLEEFPAPSR
ncbi:EAL domain-containing protein [Solwaraspora sp. WMMD1047]|uniref:putative bifunctional diguanylate cyclase/phosphodiesterase n=1 Tax=Solwaraspora sp. WMMD1047 TaxID=3016102 RepID=UPI002415D61A|nr:EAL domain-containing protein [Solwaraspora sp. WMMD1047]MDG4829409.1 EAL domain-containing protein [Solwaraspora sp. WMMD1047]